MRKGILSFAPQHTQGLQPQARLLSKVQIMVASFSMQSLLSQEGKRPWNPNGAPPQITPAGLDIPACHRHGGHPPRLSAGHHLAAAGVPRLRHELADLGGLPTPSLSHKDGGLVGMQHLDKIVPGLPHRQPCERPLESRRCSSCHKGGYTSQTGQDLRGRIWTL